MNPWKILKIKITAEESAIKKAYAIQLRKHHPEDDPEGYQALREAYDFALKYAKSMKISESGIVENENIENEELIIDQYNLPSINPYAKEETDPETVQFFKQAEVLYNDFFSRIEVSNWEVLIKNEVVCNIDNSQNPCLSILDFFSKHHFLPPDIWKRLNNHFNWCDPECFTYLEDYSDFIQYIQDQISYKRPCNYSCFKPGDNIEFEEYLTYRENAYKAFLTNDFNEVEYSIEHAKGILKDDLDLIYIEGKFCLLTDKFDEAVRLFSRFLVSDPENNEVLLYLTIAYFEKGQDKDYRDCFHRLNKRFPRIDEMPYFIANSYYGFGEFVKAYKWIRIAMESSPTSRVKVLWSQISSRLKLKLEDEHENDPLNDDIALQIDSIENDIKKMNIGDIKTKKTIKERFRLSPQKIFWIIWIIYLVVRYISRWNN